MTLGQILFYSGLGLLAATALVGVLFLIWKPKYTPDSPVYRGMNQGNVPPMYNGYPTDPLRHRGGQAGWPSAGAPSGQMPGGTPPVGYGAVQQPPQATLPLPPENPPQR